MAKEAGLYGEFLTICKLLNCQLGIVPVLYGSLGLTKAAKIDFSPQDIDVLVPVVFLQEKWEILKAFMEQQDYSLIDLTEHEFQKADVKLGFSFTEDLKDFAGVDDKKLEAVVEEGAYYYQLSPGAYLKVYRHSSRDGYRRTKNNDKDLEKLEVLKVLIGSPLRESWLKAL
ncbi:hypothetical protein [Planomicrobium sp. CPCC 101079]|uniref:hypothetical protein n=1 Tax=Planomicrobium sp. CPCC 101079 TaxID=2599618 RepID=UPI0011B6DC40|nr:hypothetical protein [Planomicrobium sp. CPCC 101079]TWT02528.1 hypothetical protein FQV28_13885 [Planomicrobium sp. CPCC 101079]